MAEQSDKVTYYRLPVEDVEEGMTTADGQEVVAVSTSSGLVHIEVYTPSDDAYEDADSLAGGETRAKPAGQLMDMATFSGTAVDGSTYPRAVVDN